MIQQAHTPATLAKFWGVSSSFVYDLCKSGRLPGAFKLGGKLWRIPVTAVEAYELRQQEAAIELIPPPVAEPVVIVAAPSSREVARMIRRAG
jgi:excisionase family DNA binding protein